MAFKDFFKKKLYHSNRLLNDSKYLKVKIIFGYVEKLYVVSKGKDMINL